MKLKIQFGRGRSVSVEFMDQSSYAEDVGEPWWL